METDDYKLADWIDHHHHVCIYDSEPFDPKIKVPVDTQQWLEEVWATAVVGEMNYITKECRHHMVPRANESILKEQFIKTTNHLRRVIHYHMQDAYLDKRNMPPILLDFHKLGACATLALRHITPFISLEAYKKGIFHPFAGRLKEHAPPNQLMSKMCIMANEYVAIMAGAEVVASGVRLEAEEIKEKHEARDPIYKEATNTQLAFRDGLVFPQGYQWHMIRALGNAYQTGCQDIFMLAHLYYWLHKYTMAESGY